MKLSVGLVPKVVIWLLWLYRLDLFENPGFQESNLGFPFLKKTSVLNE